MKKNVLILAVLFISITCFSQTAELISAGALRFLTSNPTTANRLDPSAIQGMNMISNLLLVGSKRKHDMNVANAGRTEINLTSRSDGSQATMVLDTEGNVYVLSNGMVYPISKKIVEEAQEEFVPKNARENEFIPPYNLEELDDKFVFDKAYTDEMSETYTVVKKGGEYMSEITAKYAKVISKKIIYWRGRENDEKIAKMMNNQMILKEGTRLTISYLDTYYAEKLNFLFTCKWARDFDENGYEFEDFQGIKNSFSSSEQITFVAGYQLPKEGCRYFLTIFEYDNGEEIFKIEKQAPSGNRIIMQSINTESVSPGRYVFNFKIRKDGEKLLSESGKFEIVK